MHSIAIFELSIFREGYDQLPVINKNGEISGVATLGSLKAKLLKVRIKNFLFFFGWI